MLITTFDIINKRSRKQLREIKCIYVADDGTEFFNEQDCIKHDEDIRRERAHRKNEDFEILNKKYKAILATYDAEIEKLYKDIDLYESIYPNVEIILSPNDELMELKKTKNIFTGILR